MSDHWLCRSSGLLQHLTSMAAFVQSRMSFSNHLTTKNTAEQKVNEMQLSWFSFGRCHYIILTWNVKPFISATCCTKWLMRNKSQGFQNYLTYLMYVGVIWFVFMFSNSYWLDLYNKIHVALANLRWNISKNGLKFGPPLIVDLLTKYIGLPIVFTIECRGVINI